MDREKRMGLIKQLEEECGGPCIVYITGDRPGLETKIATDIFPMFHKHLMQIGEQDCINLFLYSTGGITMAGYALVNLFREFCKDLNVIIPFKAHSCATLISLGANKVIMTPIGQLSPIDPSIEHPLGPVVQIPGQPMGRIAPVNVEDVNGFIELARKDFELSKEESMEKVFEILTSKIHPLALGTIQRTREQIALLAKNLMKYHCDDDEKIKKVVNALIRERFSHDYIISRREAEEILELNVIKPNDSVVQCIMDLFKEYNELFELDTPFHPETILVENNSIVSTFNRGIIESSDLTHVFRTTKEIKKIQVPQPGSPVPGEALQERLLQEGWIEDYEI